MNKIYRNIRFDWPLHFILLLSNLFPDNVIFLRFRGVLISPFFKKCGKNLKIGRHNTFIDSYDISIGNDVYIAKGNWFNGTGGIEIGDEVIFGPNSIIVTSNHTRLNKSYRFGMPKIEKIIICRGSWIGGNCSILSGTNIGSGSVIGAGSVVKGEWPENVLIAGNPAIIKKELYD